MFYTNKCGAITTVTISKHKKKKAVYAKSMYAVVAFAHSDSVEVSSIIIDYHMLLFDVLYSWQLI